MVRRVSSSMVLGVLTGASLVVFFGAHPAVVVVAALVAAVVLAVHAR